MVPWDVYQLNRWAVKRQCWRFTLLSFSKPSQFDQANADIGRMRSHELKYLGYETVFCLTVLWCLFFATQTAAMLKAGKNQITLASLRLYFVVPDMRCLWRRHRVYFVRLTPATVFCFSVPLFAESCFSKSWYCSILVFFPKLFPKFMTWFLLA